MRISDWSSDVCSSDLNEELLGPLVEEERAVSVTLAMLQDRVPASFTEIAPRSGTITIAAIPSAQLVERRRLAIEGSGLSVSEYRLASDSDAVLEERSEEHTSELQSLMRISYAVF